MWRHIGVGASIRDAAGRSFAARAACTVLWARRVAHRLWVWQTARRRLDRHLQGHESHLLALALPLVELAREQREGAGAHHVGHTLRVHSHPVEQLAEALRGHVLGAAELEELSVARAQLGEYGLQLGQCGAVLREVPDEGSLSVGDDAEDRTVRHAWTRLAPQLLGEQHPESGSGGNGFMYLKCEIGSSTIRWVRVGACHSE